MFPTLNDGLNEEVNLPPIDNTEGSKQTMYTHSDDWWQFHDGRGGDWFKLLGIASFLGQNLASVEVDTGDIVLDDGHKRPIAVVARHSRPPMMWCGLLLKSIAGFRLLGVIQWPLDCILRADATTLRHEPTVVDATIA